MTASVIIPQKSQFKFQELTPLTGVKPYVLRFWETEFDEISPASDSEGEKIYTREDVLIILEIKKLLFEDKLSIPEARLRLGQQGTNTTETKESINDFQRDTASSSARELLVQSLELISERRRQHSW